MYPLAPAHRQIAARLALLTLFALSCGTGEDHAVGVRLASGPVVSTRAAEPGRGRPLRFAFASVLSPAISTVPYARFTAYLAKRLDRRVEIVRRRTYGELNEMLREGRADVGIVCTGAYTVGREEFGLRQLAVPIIGGETTYRAYVIARRAEAYADLESLRGVVFAFSDPLSNTGYRYVAAELHARGEVPERFFDRTVFTYSHDNTIRAVRDGLARAGVVDSLIWDELVREDPRLLDELAIVERSEAFPINPVVASPRTGPELTSKLSELLIAMSSDPVGVDVLDGLGISGFTTLSEADYDAVAQSWRELGVIKKPKTTPEHR